jgi:RNA polymerase sigma-70 factor (ECF subfamily)
MNPAASIDLDQPALRDCSLRPSASEPASMDSCDRSLVRRAQSGDRGAFNLLVRKYRHRVMKLAMRYTHNFADAEDAVQDIFMRAYWGLQHFRGDSAFYSWLHRIAINSAKSALVVRARNARVFSLSAETTDDSGESTSQLKDLDTPEELALTDEICGAVNAAIDALCAEQRAAIVLRELNGLSYARVASIMSCPVGTVRSRVFRAREAIDRRLRQVFDEGLGRGGDRSIREMAPIPVAASIKRRGLFGYEGNTTPPRASVVADSAV